MLGLKFQVMFNRNYPELGRIVSFEELHVYTTTAISPSP